MLGTFGDDCQAARWQTTARLVLQTVSSQLPVKAQQRHRTAICRLNVLFTWLTTIYYHCVCINDLCMIEFLVPSHSTHSAPEASSRSRAGCQLTHLDLCVELLVELLNLVGVSHGAVHFVREAADLQTESSGELTSLSTRGSPRQESPCGVVTYPPGPLSVRRAVSADRRQERQQISRTHTVAADTDDSRQTAGRTKLQREASTSGIHISTTSNSHLFS